MECSVVVEPCINVVYVSSAVETFSHSDLIELVRKSSEANSARGLTGMLLHKEGSFIQALEGPESIVHGLLTKIKRDPRHTGMLTLIERKIEVRYFADWSMGFRDLNTLSESEKEVFGPYLSVSLASEAFEDRPTAALKLLKRFKETMR